MFNDFPYTNYHEFNLDWIMEQLAVVKSLSLTECDHKYAQNLTSPVPVGGTLTVCTETLELTAPDDGNYTIEWYARCTGTTGTHYAAGVIIDDQPVVSSIAALRGGAGVITLDSSHPYCGGQLPTVHLTAGTHTFTIMVANYGTAAMNIAAIEAYLSHMEVSNPDV